MKYEPLITAYESRSAAEMRARYRGVKAKLWPVKRPLAPALVMAEPLKPIEKVSEPARSCLDAKDVIRATAAHFRVRYEDVVGQGRQFPLVRIRVIAIWIMRQRLPGLSLVRIGRTMHRDSSTILHHLKKVQRDPVSFESDIGKVERLVSAIAFSRRPVDNIEGGTQA